MFEARPQLVYDSSELSVSSRKWLNNKCQTLAAGLGNNLKTAWRARRRYFSISTPARHGTVFLGTLANCP